MELFNLFGKIAVDNAEANEQIEETSEKAESFSSKLASGIGTAAKWGTAIVAGATAASTALVGFASSSASTADNIDKMSQKIGISREAYQELDFIMSQSGASVDGLQSGMKTLVSAMSSAADGTESNIATFERLGISVTDANGNLRSTEEVFYETIEALQGVENQTEKAALASELFGKSGTELMPLLNSEVGSMEAMKVQAHELGLVLNDELIDNGVELTDSLDQTKRAFGSIVTQLGGSLMPIVTKVSDYIQTSIPQIQGVVAKLSPILTGLLDSLLPPLMSLVGTIFPILITLIETLLPPITEIITNVLPIITSLLQAVIVPIVKIVEVLLPPLVKIINAILPLFVQIINAILPPLTELINALLPIVQKVIDTLLPVIIQLIETLIPIIMQIIDAILPVVIELFNRILPILTKIIESVLPVVISLLNVLTPILEALLPILQPILELLMTLLEPLFDLLDVVLPVLTTLLKGVASVIDSVVKPIMVWITNFLSGTFGNVLNAIKENIGNVRNAFAGAWEGIKNVWSVAGSFFTSIWEGIKKPFATVADWFKNIFTNAWTAVKNVFSTGGKIFDGIKDGIVTAFKTVVNGIIGGINKVISVPFNAINSVLQNIKSIDILGIKPFNWITTFSVPQIPTLAKGGVLKQGQVGFLEGDGDEAVVPLEKNTGWIKEVAQKINDFDIERERSVDRVSSKNEIITVIKEEVGKRISNVEAMISDLILMLGEYYPKLLDKFDISVVMNDGVLVARLAPKIDKEIGAIYRRKERA